MSCANLRLDYRKCMGSIIEPCGMPHMVKDVEDEYITFLLRFHQ